MSSGISPCASSCTLSAASALGVAAMLDANARIDTDCDDCGEPIVLEVRDGDLETEGVAHFAVPAAHWWDDIGFT